MEVAQVGHVAVGKNIMRAAHMVDTVFLGKDVHRQRADLLGFDTFNECLDVHELTAAHIYQYNPVAHLGDGTRVDNPARGVHERNMDRDEVASLIQLIKSYVGDVTALREVVVREGIVGEDFAAKTSKIVNDRSSDATRMANRPRKSICRVPTRASERYRDHVP